MCSTAQRDAEASAPQPTTATTLSTVTALATPSAVTSPAFISIQYEFQRRRGCPISFVTPPRIRWGLTPAAVATVAASTGSQV